MHLISMNPGSEMDATGSQSTSESGLDVFYELELKDSEECDDECVL